METWFGLEAMPDMPCVMPEVAILPPMVRHMTESVPRMTFALTIGFCSSNLSATSLVAEVSILRSRATIMERTMAERLA